MVFHHFKSMIGSVQESNMSGKEVNPREDNAQVERKFLSNLDKHMNRENNDLSHPTEKAGKCSNANRKFII